MRSLRRVATNFAHGHGHACLRTGLQDPEPVVRLETRVDIEPSALWLISDKCRRLRPTADAPRETGGQCGDTDRHIPSCRPGERHGERWLAPCVSSARSSA